MCLLQCEREGGEGVTSVGPLSAPTGYHTLSQYSRSPPPHPGFSLLNVELLKGARVPPMKEELLFGRVAGSIWAGVKETRSRGSVDFEGTGLAVWCLEFGIGTLFPSCTALSQFRKSLFLK